MADVKGEPVVLADDILTTTEAQVLAENAAASLRNAMQRQSGRHLRMTIIPGAYPDEPVATVTVLHESAYIVDLGVQLRSRL